jgi:hypothetical protein
MQFKGMILGLDNFDGNIVLDRNTFQNNFLKYKTCDAVANNMQSGFYSGTDKYTNYGAKDVL